jgi:glycosyltransferase involved in cell wall biosynthesis
MDISGVLANVSVIIPTFNRAELVAQVLPSYLQFCSVKEVLVVDDGSSDNTREVLARLQEVDSRVRPLLHPTNRGMEAARNTGLSYATGDLILISEDDLELSTGSLDVLVDHMAESGADIIAGRRIWMRSGESREEALHRADRDRRPPINTRMLDVNSSVSAQDDLRVPLVNATMLVRQDVLDDVRFAGCYKGNAWREESDFQLTALEKGYSVFFCPHAIFFHHDRPRIGRNRGRVKGDIQVLYWIFRNNLIFLRRHYPYLKQHYPESLWLGSPHLTSVAYLIHRAVWLIKSEVRRGFDAARQFILSHE